MFSLYDKKVRFLADSQFVLILTFFGAIIFNSVVVMFQAPQHNIGQTFSAVWTIDPKIFKNLMVASPNAKIVRNLNTESRNKMKIFITV